MSGVSLAKTRSPANTTSLPGTWTTASPAVCPGPSSSSRTSRPPTSSVASPSKTWVGMRCVTSAISKVPNRVRAKCANSSPISVEANVALTAAGVDIAHASRAVDVAQIAMPSGRSSLPKQ